VSQSAELIARSFEEWGLVPHVVREVFSDASPVGVAAALDEFCRLQLGSAVQSSEFFDASVGSVHGLRLCDGRRVVVKVHGSRVAVEFLSAVRTVQQHVFEGGFPAPRPVLGPVPFGVGTAGVEALNDTGEHADAHRPYVRRAMASSLARLVELARPFTGLRGLRQHMMEVRENQLWPVPHDGRLDFEATSDGAEWIDRIAAQARSVRDRHVGAMVVGHTDWRVQNMRLSEGCVTAVYDWDSLSILREPVLVGSVAHGFTTNWAVDDWRQFPSLSETAAFIADYEQARGAPFDSEERAVARASLAYTMAYTARCEHSDAFTDIGRHPPEVAATSKPPAGTARAFLAAHAADLLGEEVGQVPEVG
jgi:hypothetical protein